MCLSSVSLLTEKFLGRSLNRLQASAPSLTAWASFQKLWAPTPRPSLQQTALLARLMLVLTPNVAAQSDAPAEWP